LKDAGVDVTWASARFTYTHEKCFIIDNTTAWIDTMNATYSARTANREYLVPDTDPADIAEAEAIFEADHAGATIKPTGKLVVSPVSMRSGIENLIAGAKTSLQFEVEEFDDGDIASAMCAATKRGVKAEGLLSNATQSSTGKSTVTTLKGCGVPMKMLATPYVHAKAIVVDGARAYIGSANFSPTSLDQNRELGVITADSTAVGTVAKTIAGDISSGTAL
jgi:phosphatidylserine/phosphatidylglycerophosphate/cardiolipin synthase-like enzyme